MPNSTNRGFILKSLENAAKLIHNDDSIEIEPVIDRDTSGIPGSPDIASTIFSKIDECDIFACDVTIINKQDDNPRPTPNPNVLIELGYAMKTLGLGRIIMIMNTAFGGPELLPFDLSKKRILPYRINPEDTGKSVERSRLTQFLADAIKTIVSHTSEPKTKGKRSGRKDKLKEECKDVLLHGNKQDWRKLVDELWRDIPKQILEWKPKAEQIWEKGETEREVARSEAVEICLPSFIPILVAVENGRIDLWQEAVAPLRQLLLFSNKMGGGYTEVVEIGSHMLYFAGNLGMAIAIQTKQLDFVNKWMQLPMPDQYNEKGEKTWAEVYQAHHLWGGYIQDHFEGTLKICKSEYLSRIFTDTNQLVRHLRLGNLVQSLYELKQYVKDEKDCEAIETRNIQKFKGSLLVHPAWLLMKPDEFKEATWDLFGSSDGVLKFVFPSEDISAKRFWAWWKIWKEICISNMGYRPFISRQANYLTLPGEPID
jgi:hypothetical protein